MNQVESEIPRNNSPCSRGNDLNSKECSDFHILTNGERSLSYNDVQDEEGWRFPELGEVIADLKSLDDDMKVNAAAYLQHLAYKNDSIKSFARELHAFAPLVEMLRHTNHEVIKSALGALRNLSCGKVNDLNKVEIMVNDGIKILVELIRTSQNHLVIEMASGLLWNLSSCPVLKDEILQKSLDVMFNYIIMPLLCCISSDISQPPHKLNFNNFRHATGVLRNVSSCSTELRGKLHQHGGLVSSLMSFVTWSSKHRDVDEKSIENCLCIMRNLSLDLEECFFDRQPRSRSLGRRTDAKRLNLDSSSPSCFRIKKSSKNQKQSLKFSLTDECLTPENSLQTFKMLMRPEVIAMFMQLLHIHSNKVDICEATFGIIQNLYLSNLQASHNVVECIRKCHGMPIVVQHLTALSDKLVLSACIVLKHLISSYINQDVIGRIIMDHLLSRTPSCKCEAPYSFETYNLLSNTVFECIGSNIEFARYALVTGGIKQLSNVVLSPASFGIRASELAAIVLKKIWSFHDMHEEMKVRGLKKSDFMIEPPKKGSIEDLDCGTDGRCKRVRFVETSSGEEFHTSLPNVVPPTPGNLIQPPHEGIPSTSDLIISSTLTKHCSSISLSKHQFQPLFSSSFFQQRCLVDSNILFPCCYPGPQTSIAMSSAVSSKHSTNVILPDVSLPPSSSNSQIISQPTEVFIPANSWV